MALGSVLKSFLGLRRGVGLTCFNSPDGYASQVGRDFQELPGLRVEVKEVIFMAHLSAPPEKPYPFVYFISISNHSKEVVTIQGRKWIVREDDGEITVVEGRGVVGEMPEIRPGEEFSYNSYHVVRKDSEASGAFFGEDSKGQGIRVSIPVFKLNIPQGA